MRPACSVAIILSIGKFIVRRVKFHIEFASKDDIARIVEPISARVSNVLWDSNQLVFFESRLKRLWCITTQVVHSSAKRWPVDPTRYLFLIIANADVRWRPLIVALGRCFIKTAVSVNAVRNWIQIVKVSTKVSTTTHVSANAINESRIFAQKTTWSSIPSFANVQNLPNRPRLRFEKIITIVLYIRL